MKKFQSSKSNIISADRSGRGSSQFAAWVRENYTGKFIVSTSAIDADGEMSHELLKNRGYEFSGAGSDSIERGLLVGKKCWFKSFDSEDEAEAEIEAICDDGI